MNEKQWEAFLTRVVGVFRDECPDNLGVVRLSFEPLEGSECGCRPDGNRVEPSYGFVWVGRGEFAVRFGGSVREVFGEERRSKADQIREVLRRRDAERGAEVKGGMGLRREEKADAERPGAEVIAEMRGSR